MFARSFAVGALPLAAVLAAALVSAGCAVGPDFKRPEAPQPAAYTRSPVTLPGAGSSDPTQSLVDDAAVQVRWWNAFRSAELSQIVQLAIEGSPNLQAARANLAQAREAILVARGGLYPQVDVNAGALREHSGANVSARSAAGAITYNQLSAALSVSYNPDAFGGARRLVEQQSALAEVQRYELAAAYLSLTGGAVGQIINIASAQEQIAAIEDILAVDDKNLELVRIAFESGKVAQTDVLNARSQLAADRALLPPVRQQLNAAQHALAVLLGRAPAEWESPPFDLAALNLPAELPIRVPSVLASERPDILAAEAQLHAATAAIGVATARLYPSLTLSASWVQDAATLGVLFDSANGIWTLAAQIVAPVYHGGALEAQRRAAVYAMAAQLAIYRQTVLQAFGQIADTLRALQHDAETIAAQREALDSAQAALQLDQESYAAGQATFLQVLQSQRLYQQARLAYARARAQRYQDTVQLFLAMGGGWEGVEAIDGK